MDIILKYFANLSNTQLDQFREMESKYAFWNAQINVISRKDFPEFYERHVLHSLAIAKFTSFTRGSSILDVGTGGGFPGIPLAIMFPDVDFHLIDSIGKKIKVVNDISTSLNIKNVVAEQVRAEQLTTKYDFVISRAVTKLPAFVSWIRNNISHKQKNAVSNGILYLKGGNLENEINAFRKQIFIQELSDYFEEEFFETKKLLHLPL